LCSVAVAFGLTWQWDSEVLGRFHETDERGSSLLLELVGISSGWKVAVSEKVRIVEITCDEVRRELVEYMEGDLKPDLRLRIDQHLDHCEHCTAIYDGVRNVVELIGAQGSIELPKGFSQRLRMRFLNQTKQPCQ
jgi:Putative zinc-finger